MPIFRRTKAVLLHYILNLIKVPVTVHREQSMKREKTNKMQQLDDYKLLPQYVSGIIMPIFRKTKNPLQDSAPQPLPTTSSRTRTIHQMHYHGLCSAEDGHNDARNMSRQKLIINI